jgi:hypothetical protein
MVFFPSEAPTAAAWYVPVCPLGNLLIRLNADFAELQLINQLNSGQCLLRIFRVEPFQARICF